MNEVGIDNFYIELIELYPCQTKDELRAREGFFKREMATLNTKVAGRTKAEYYKENKDQIAIVNTAYNDTHSEKMQQYYKQYREEHKDQQKEYMRKYQESHREHIKQYKEQTKEHKQEYQRKYIESHREELEARKRNYNST